MHDELNAIVILDKPADISSAQAVARVKRILGAAKCGHAGTLDPFATGVLICCVNQATRLAGFFLHGTKSYEALLRLGIRTDTQDHTGQVLQRANVPSFTAQQLRTVFGEFEGSRQQQPPIYSALKHKGTTLYKLARKGKPVQKPPRSITIERLRIIETRLPDIRFEIKCSAGTYVRTLCSDIGDRLGCGGHLAELRRTASSQFGIADAISLEKLQALVACGDVHKGIVEMAAALDDIPTITADNALLEHVRHGRDLTIARIPSAVAVRAIEGTADGYIKIVDQQNRLKAVVRQTGQAGSYNYCCVFN